MASPTMTLLRWAFRLSLLAGCIAVVLQLHIPITYQLSRFLSQSTLQGLVGQGSVEQVERVLCYEGIRPDAVSSTDRRGNCFAIADGRFTRVLFAREDVEGTTEPMDANPDRKVKLKRETATDSEVERGEGTVKKGYVIPGIWDGHGHLLQYGEFLHSADLFGSASADEVRERLARYVEGNPSAGGKGEWARGVGWDQMVLGEMPTAAMLEADPRLQGKYFMLDRVDVHCTWVSQAILDLLPEHLPDIPGGEIVRTPGMGVFCDNAMDLIVSLWPKPSPERKKEFITSAMKEMNKVGIVGMHDAGVLPADIALYDEMSQDWTVRVYAMLECKERNTFCPDEAIKIAQDSGFLSVRSVKLFADGALGSWGSAMIEPYTDRPDTVGSLLVNASTLTSLAKSWSRAGFQVNIHAIGDLANRYAIDAIETALGELCPGQSLAACQADHRFRIEHSQIIHPDDQERMHAIGIIPSIQPTHATSDMAYAELRLGSARTATEAYRMRSLLDLQPVLGSDFPVEPPNPFEGLYAAVTRRNPRTGAGPGWQMEEALSLKEALGGFTTGAARGAFLEGRAGVIQPGAYADWVVLDEPLEDVDDLDLRHVRVMETWVGGRMVYSRDH